MHKVILILIALIWPAILVAQPKLVLFRKDNIVYRFQEGEYIRFKRKKDDGFARGVITGIHANYFQIQDDTTYTYDIEKIDLRGKHTMSFKTASFGKKLIIAGVTLFLIDIFNKTVIQNKSYAIDNSVTPVAMAFVGAGAVLQVVNNSIFKTGRRKKVATIIPNSH